MAGVVSWHATSSSGCLPREGDQAIHERLSPRKARKARLVIINRNVYGGWRGGRAVSGRRDEPHGDGDDHHADAQPPRPQEQEHDSGHPGPGSCRALPRHGRHARAGHPLLDGFFQPPRDAGGGVRGRRREDADHARLCRGDSQRQHRSRAQHPDGRHQDAPHGGRLERRRQRQRRERARHGGRGRDARGAAADNG